MFMKFLLRYISILSTILLLLFFQSCTSFEKRDQSVQLARVGNDILTLNMVREKLPDFMLKEDSLASIKTYRENWIQRKLILHEAERLNIRQNKSVQTKLKKAEQEILTEALKDYVIAQYEEELEVTDEEARNYYQVHKNKFILNERYVQFRHIETQSLSEAQSAKRDLMRGISWPKVAREYSLNPEVKINQSEQYWPESMALSDLNILNRYLGGVIGITEISPIQRIKRNYHFVQLMDSKAKGDHPDLEWLIEQIKDWLVIEKRRRHYSSYIKNLYLKATSNNEIDSYNVLESNSNPQPSTPDTFEINQTDE